MANEVVLAPLSDEERELFVEQEKKLDKHESAFFESIRALKVIRDKELYREKHVSFEAYLAHRRLRFKTAERANQLINHVMMLDVLAQNASVEILPENERQTRELKKLTDPTEIAAAWLGAQAAADEDQPSSGYVKSGVETVEESNATGGFVDRTGFGDMAPANDPNIFADAVLAKQEFRRKRQRSYIKPAPPTAVFEGLFAGRGQKPERRNSITLRVKDLPDEMWSKLAGQNVRLVVYAIAESPKKEVQTDAQT